MLKNRIFSFLCCIIYLLTSFESNADGQVDYSSTTFTAELSSPSELSQLPKNLQGGTGLICRNSIRVIEYWIITKDKREIAFFYFMFDKVYFENIRMAVMLHTYKWEIGAEEFELNRESLSLKTQFKELECEIVTPERIFDIAKSQLEEGLRKNKI